MNLSDPRIFTSTIRSEAKQTSTKSVYYYYSFSQPRTFNADQVDLQNDLLSALATNKDLYLTSTPLEQKRCTREAIALHALNHITKYVTKYHGGRTLFLTYATF